MHPSGQSAFAGITTFASGLHIPMCQSLIIGPNALYGKIDYPSGTSELRFSALNQMRFRVWDGGGYEDWAYIHGPGGQVCFGGTQMGNGVLPFIKMCSPTREFKVQTSDGSSHSDRIVASTAGVNIIGVTTVTGLSLIHI